jgi:hypothetical protein
MRVPYLTSPSGSSLEHPKLTLCQTLFCQVPIQYLTLPGDFYKELEACLEREVMDAITAARKLVYTHFNRRCALWPCLLFGSSSVRSSSVVSAIFLSECLPLFSGLLALSKGAVPKHRTSGIGADEMNNLASI